MKRGLKREQVGVYMGKCTDFYGVAGSSVCVCLNVVWFAGVRWRMDRSALGLIDCQQVLVQSDWRDMAEEKCATKQGI